MSLISTHIPLISLSDKKNCAILNSETLSNLTIKSNLMRSITLTALLLTILTAAETIYSQSAIMPSGSSLSRSNSAPRMSGESKLGGDPLNVGPVTLRAGSYYRYISNANLRSQPGTLSDTSLSEMGLVFDGELGERGSLYYSPRWSDYSSSAFGNQFSHEFGGKIGNDGTMNIGGWDFEIQPFYSNQHRILTETAQLTETEDLGLGITGQYRLNSATSIGLGTDYSLKDSEGFNSRENHSYKAFFTRTVGNTVNTTLGYSDGRDKTNTNFDADYNQISVGVDYQPSEYLYFSAIIGQQERSFNIIGSEDLDSAVHSLRVNFTPLEFTTVSIRSNNSISASLFENQTSDNESLSVFLNQRLLGFIDLSLGLGKTEYSLLAANQSNQESRSDSYDFFDARVSAEVIRRLSLSVFYRDQENDSSISLYGFSGDQYGVSVFFSF